MADYDSGLPIRSEADGTDERVHVKIVDGTNPSVNQTEVDSDKNLHVEVHGNRADDAADVALELSEEGKPNGRGDYHVDDNSEPNSTGLVAGIRSAGNAATDQTEHITSVESSDNTVRALDVSLHDEFGEPFGPSNPLPVSLEESEGDEVCDYQTSSSVASDATVDHDYTVSASRTLVGVELWISASGKCKAEVKVETAAASGTFTTKFVAFNSTAEPNIRIPLARVVKQVTGAKVRITLTNRDNQAQDLYSTLLAAEIA